MLVALSACLGVTVSSRPFLRPASSHIVQSTYPCFLPVVLHSVSIPLDLSHSPFSITNRPPT